ncbi:hypothetical protein N0V90_007026 [Kalmusia sp. IMI 367209]|nr:hypothetical protein N0V90_007026 [Kalmusia sp. IMI 367209]
MKVTPVNWPIIIQQKNVIFLDISVVEEFAENTPSAFSWLTHHEELIKISVPPFYHWPSASEKSDDRLDSLSADVRHAIRCLEQVEKSMLNETLPEFDTGGPVDRTFTSTKYYESLPEDTFEDIEQSLLSRVRLQDSGAGKFHRTHHQNIIHNQSSKLAHKAHEFMRVVHDTLCLFVGDVDKCALLRKVWGAMANVSAIIGRLQKHPACDSDPKEYSDPGWKTTKTGTRSWRIRTPTISYTYSNQGATKFDLPLPDNDKEFGDAVKKCRRCAREAPFDSPTAALEHLRNHVVAEATKQGGSASSSFVKGTEELKDWVRNDDQALLESTIAGACTILHRATDEARVIYEQLYELANGVRNDQGELSDLYTFPRKLLETLHRLLVFYFAVERSLYYTEEDFDRTKKGGSLEDYPYSNLGLEVLNRFSDSVKSPLLQARVELCEMVRSQTPNDYSERISWGPESISSWLMRRLIVKPLEKSMTVGDMYREYLTTLQFQVNHRPGKRLLRSINLLQEELTILAQVNDWQTQLVQNYIRVLDDSTYPVDIPSRRALFPFEKLLLNSCLENLALTREEYEDQIRRCGPLSDTTKQSAEINEEDHGKAILVFTVVTVIFLPLSFVTSYLGMNTSDIRDMDNKQSLFWEIALPLTVSVMAIMMAIAYNGDEIRDFSSSVYRSLTGKQARNLSMRGISVMQRKRAVKNPGDSSSTLSMADDAEYAAPKPKPDFYHEVMGYHSAPIRSRKAIPTVEFANVETSFKKKGRADVWSEDEWYSPRTRARPQPKYDPVPVTTYAEPAALRPPPPPPVPGPPDGRPTYMRIHRKYIVPSVLDGAYLPWEYDPRDSNYIIIQQYLEDWEIDGLFNKSRTLMNARETTPVRPVGYKNDDLWTSGRGEYVWVNKRKRRIRPRPRAPYV